MAKSAIALKMGRHSSLAGQISSTLLLPAGLVGLGSMAARNCLARRLDDNQER